MNELRKKLYKNLDRIFIEYKEEFIKKDKILEIRVVIHEIIGWILDGQEVSKKDILTVIAQETIDRFEEEKNKKKENKNRHIILR